MSVAEALPEDDERKFAEICAKLGGTERGFLITVIHLVLELERAGRPLEVDALLWALSLRAGSDGTLAHGPSGPTAH